jgi:hypothetical protein
MRVSDSRKCSRSMARLNERCVIGRHAENGDEIKEDIDGEI